MLSKSKLSTCRQAQGERKSKLHKAEAISWNAGAETQVMSLWEVNDNATRDLMVDYYKRLLSGTARAQALKQAQLALINSKDRNHPYYWAAFIASGNVRPMAK